MQPVRDELNPALTGPAWRNSGRASIADTEGAGDGARVFAAVDQIAGLLHLRRLAAELHAVPRGRAASRSGGQARSARLDAPDRRPPGQNQPPGAFGFVRPLVIGNRRAGCRAGRTAAAFRRGCRAGGPSRNCSPYWRTISTAGFMRMPTPPRSSTKAHSAAMRLTTSSAVIRNDGSSVINRSSATSAESLSKPGASSPASTGETRFKSGKPAQRDWEFADFRWQVIQNKRTYSEYDLIDSGLILYRGESVLRFRQKCMPPRRLPVAEEEIIAALEETPHATRVARELGVSFATVWRLAERAGIELTAGKAAKGRRLQPEQRAKIVEIRLAMPHATQEEVARRAGVSRPTVSRITGGRRRRAGVSPER